MQIAKIALVGFIAGPVGWGYADGWGVSRDILDSADSTRVASVPLDDHVFANSQAGWIDVRVVTAAGQEVPRDIVAGREYRFEARHTARAARIRTVEPLADGGLAVVCEIEGTNAVCLTQATIRTPLRNFERAVSVYVPSATGWRPVCANEPLFDYSRYADVKKETVELPGVTNRLFRMVFGQADDAVFSAYETMTEERAGEKDVSRRFKRYSVENRPFRIDAVSFRDTEQAAVSGDQRVERQAPPSPAVVAQNSRRSTVLTFSSARWPVVGLELNPEQKNYERRLTVECAVPGGWRLLGEGAVRRTNLPGLPASEQNAIGFPEVRAERMRVVIANDDNPPLTFGPEGVMLRRQTYRAVFIAEKGERYRLVYGNPAIQAAPVYEQEVWSYLRRGKNAAQWSLAAAPEGAVSYGFVVQVRLFLARHGMLLFSVLVMAALGVLIQRALKHAKP